MATPGRYYTYVLSTRMAYVLLPYLQVSGVGRYG
jgi:hypothetical protein